jgi:hypothetical protein
MLQPDRLLRTAIENTRVLRFVYHGKDRVVEPHDHGILNGSVQFAELAGGRIQQSPSSQLAFDEG